VTLNDYWRSLFWGRTVLWVDDDSYYVSYRSEVLRDLGCIVIQASSVEQAKGVLKAEGDDIALVIVDAMMDAEPGEEMIARGGFQTGLEFVRWMSYRGYRHIPVVGHSNSRVQEVVDWFFEYTIHFLRKGESDEEMLRCFAWALEIGKQKRYKKSLTFLSYTEKMIY
jgi:CheY-like chemotaxis protein